MLLVLTTHPLTVHKRPAVAFYCAPCDRWPDVHLVERTGYTTPQGEPASIVGLACSQCRVRHLEERPCETVAGRQEELFS